MFFWKVEYSDAGLIDADPDLLAMFDKTRGDEMLSDKLALR